MTDPTHRAGWGRWFRPFIVVLVALAAGVLLVAPMVTMEPRELPIAVVDLDAGFETPQGTLAAGEQVVGTVTASGADGMLAWQSLDSQETLDEALENNDIYAALVVPSDFSESQVMARQGAGEVSPLTLIVNEGKHPMVSAQLSGSIDELTAGIDVPVEVEAYNEIPASLGLSATVLPMLFMILVYLASYVGGIVIRSTFPLYAGETAQTQTPSKGRGAATQLGLAVLTATIVGTVSAGVLSAFAPDLDFSFTGAAVFLAIASFALMTLVIGSINWLGMAGMIVPVAVLLLGLGTANLPYEFLPSFWQDWVYPWNPLRFLAEGSRALMFQSAGWWNPATLGLIVTGVVGVALVGTSVLKPAKKEVNR
ncbi:YhgE/Pip domain-containing protein [Corynebacterium hylobatis]|uniref:YhgE/Pip domain-containing protein n=1 Tax=Corynebacterium hylobatis TaxID=1859290 RepID=UPI0013DF9766|nr:ABC transporter permease [Corynebacterium hylobatis]